MGLPSGPAPTHASKPPVRLKLSAREDDAVRLPRHKAFPHLLRGGGNVEEDRKSTRLNSSHLGISYAVFCLKKKKKKKYIIALVRVIMQSPLSLAHIITT